MADILKTIASVEWIVVGAIFLTGIIKWNNKLSAYYEELKTESERWKIEDDLR